MALVVTICIGVGWIPGTFEPVKVGLVVGDPFLDRLLGRFVRLHGLIHPPRRRTHPSGSGYASVQNAYKPSALFDVEGRMRRAWECEDSLAEAVEAEDKLDFLTAYYFANRFHGALAAGAFEWIAAPCFQDEVAPERTHVTSGLFRRCGDEGLLTSGFIGVGEVVADGLLPFGREVKEGSGDEVGSFEDLEGALGVVVALGAVAVGVR